MKITNPELKVVRFNSEDVIATSLYLMSAADYNTAAGTSYTKPYVMFNGDMTTYDETNQAWQIANIHAVTEEDDVTFFTGGYIPEVGYSIPPLAPGYTYRAFADGTVLYTNGVTFSEVPGIQ